MAKARPSKTKIVSEPGTSLKKRYLKSKDICKVTFRLPADAAHTASAVTLVGDFNDWNRESLPMKRLKSGEHTLTIDLQPGREYHYRYLIDDTRWENDWYADRYDRTPYGDADNSVVVV
jgi:1,4-alpha-glucan branching enzyme